VNAIIFSGSPFCEDQFLKMKIIYEIGRKEKASGREDKFYQ
jgi:hypothetical protein